MNFTREEEGVVLVPGWMLLGLEQRVKVPEGAFDEVVGRHLSEAEKKKKTEIKGRSICELS